MDNEKLSHAYVKTRPVLEKLAAELTDVLEQARMSFATENSHLAKPKHPEVRVKDFASIIGKLARKSVDWRSDEIYIVGNDKKVTPIANDLVGGRLVVAVPGDVEIIVNILKSWKERIQDIKDEKKEVKETGYRAWHIDCRLSIWVNNQQLWFPVEMQIKTLLQDAWSNFGHDEFYKPDSDPPKISKDIAVYLSDVLAGLDRIGEAIREEKLRKKPAPVAPDESETLVSAKTLHRKLGMDLSDVDLKQAVSQLKAYGIESMEQVSALLDDKRIAAVLQGMKTELRVPHRPEKLDMLIFGPIARVEGTDRLRQRMGEFFGISDTPCSQCSNRLRIAEKDFVDKKTDLDGSYLCEICIPKTLKKCEQCDVLTKGNICKNCKASDPANEIV